MEAQVYTGFSLGQKKIQLGTKEDAKQWKIIFLWEEISKNVPADTKDHVGVYFVG